jgi:hypothetical protein
MAQYSAAAATMSCSVAASFRAVSLLIDGFARRIRAAVGSAGTASAAFGMDGFFRRLGRLATVLRRFGILDELHGLHGEAPFCKPYSPKSAASAR